jgi:3-keto-5-aminohexanoate cleavage enzyme
VFIPKTSHGISHSRFRQFQVHIVTFRLVLIPFFNRASRPGNKLSKYYFNTHEEIETMASKMKELKIKPDVAIFDLSMIYNTADLVESGLISLPVRLMFVMGGHMALDSRKEVLEFMIKEAEHCFGEKNYTWCAVGVGWNNPAVVRWNIELGGHPRTGIEDTLMIERGVFAKNNAELVSSVAHQCQKYERKLATPEEARDILGIEK